MDGSRPLPPRVEWVDTAKAWGILLVYYGHFVQAVYKLDNNAVALSQEKLIYSFHMPLFTLLSG